MRNSLLLNAIFIFCLISACTSNKDIAQKNTFSFTSNGNQYQIVCVNTNSGEGTNYLAEIDAKGRQLSLARDLDQDGSIDLILKGEFSIDEADKVYDFGINEAKKMGNYTERVSLRTFEYLENQILFTVKTYLTDKNHASNLFLIFDNTKSVESIFLDTNADGILDSIEKGSLSLKVANEYYISTLNMGLKQKKIELLNKTYRVKEVNLLESATALK
ncbi:MAG: hypothetical protein BalsKO_06300 [Balneolaceae bacterium]